MPGPSLASISLRLCALPWIVGAIELDLWGAAQCFARLQLYRRERVRQVVRLKLLCGHVK